MKDRIIAIMNREGLTSSKFAETIGIQRAAMSHILSGRNNPSLDVSMKILETFDYINPDWLLFGKGNMVRGNSPIEPDLFTNIAENRPVVRNVSENRKEMIVESPLFDTKQPINESLIIQKSETVKIKKITVFYADNTYEDFTLEKTTKD